MIATSILAIWLFFVKNTIDTLKQPMTEGMKRNCLRAITDETDPIKGFLTSSSRMAKLLSVRQVSASTCEQPLYPNAALKAAVLRAFKCAKRPTLCQLTATKTAISQTK